MTDSVQQENKEQCAIVKPAIKIPLILIRNFFFTIVLFFIFGWAIFLFVFLFERAGLVVASISILTPFLICVLILSLLDLVSLRRTEYKFYSDRLEYYGGAVVMKRKTIDYSRISNVKQRKGIIEGLFGLGTVFIETASSSSREYGLTMRYLKNPDRIFDFIYSKIAAKKV